MALRPVLDRRPQWQKTLESIQRQYLEVAETILEQRAQLINLEKQLATEVNPQARKICRCISKP